MIQQINPQVTTKTKPQKEMSKAAYNNLNTDRKTARHTIRDGLGKKQLGKVEKIVNLFVALTSSIAPSSKDDKCKNKNYNVISNSFNNYTSRINQSELATLGQAQNLLQESFEILTPKESPNSRLHPTNKNKRTIEEVLKDALNLMHSSTGRTNIVLKDVLHAILNHPYIRHQRLGSSTAFKRSFAKLLNTMIAEIEGLKPAVGFINAINLTKDTTNALQENTKKIEESCNSIDNTKLAKLELGDIEFDKSEKVITATKESIDPTKKALESILGTIQKVKDSLNDSLEICSDEIGKMEALNERIIPNHLLVDAGKKLAETNSHLNFHLESKAGKINSNIEALKVLKAELENLKGNSELEIWKNFAKKLEIHSENLTLNFQNSVKRFSDMIEQLIKDTRNRERYRELEAKYTDLVERKNTLDQDDLKAFENLLEEKQYLEKEFKKNPKDNILKNFNDSLKNVVNEFIDSSKSNLREYEVENKKFWEGFNNGSSKPQELATSLSKIVEQLQIDKQLIKPNPEGNTLLDKVQNFIDDRPADFTKDEQELLKSYMRLFNQATINKIFNDKILEKDEKQIDHVFNKKIMYDFLKSIGVAYKNDKGQEEFDSKRFSEIVGGPLEEITIKIGSLFSSSNNNMGIITLTQQEILTIRDKFIEFYCENPKINNIFQLSSAKSEKLSKEMVLNWQAFKDILTMDNVSTLDKKVSSISNYQSHALLLSFTISLNAEMIRSKLESEPILEHKNHSALIHEAKIALKDKEIDYLTENQVALHTQRVFQQILKVIDKIEKGDKEKGSEQYWKTAEFLAKFMGFYDPMFQKGVLSENIKRNRQWFTENFIEPIRKFEKNGGIEKLLNIGFNTEDIKDNNEIAARWSGARIICLCLTIAEFLIKHEKAHHITNIAGINPEHAPTKEESIKKLYNEVQFIEKAKTLKYEGGLLDFITPKGKDGSKEKAILQNAVTSFLQTVTKQDTKTQAKSEDVNPSSHWERI